MVNFIKYKNIFLIFTVLVVIICAGLLVVYHLKLGIEFTGGSITEIQYTGNPPSLQTVREKSGHWD